MGENFCPHCMADITPEDGVCPRCGRDTQLRAQRHQMPIGSVLRSANGHSYLFGKVLGEGGFGMTYIAREMHSGTTVAIKEYFPARCQPQRQQDLSVHPDAQLEKLFQAGRQSFLSEASMLYAVRNIKSIVHVLDYFDANGTAYMVMDYLNGTTLADMLRTQERFEATLLLRRFLPFLRDLGRLHDAGVLHRDIAPDNIMLMPDGSLKLLDFGCARSLEDGKSMTVILKPGFAPIEQYQSRGQGPYTDIYAVCATLYYCLTGSVPTAAPERLTAVMDGRADPLVPPSACGVFISPELERTLMWGLALQPTSRPQAMEELAAELERAMPEEEVFQNRQEEKTDTGDEPEPAVAPQLIELLQKHGLKILLGLAMLVILLLLIFR